MDDDFVISMIPADNCASCNSLSRWKFLNGQIFCVTFRLLRKRKLSSSGNMIVSRFGGIGARTSSSVY